ncbi:PKD domain-containing protein [Cellulomonas sp. SLBN-39]|uniref:PKD domain-containing protein n=1 Tax=Cellulomonas sp. SLBN-39 TaxID=2768446 RepID=UPI001170D2C1|nr:PKD domain-containing protein [Cellulomonas sp. SLBN-39]TQL02058.1 hypothetical protein FBY24_1126 [Cellulomonas sp. SLBN-39]
MTVARTLLGFTSIVALIALMASPALAGLPDVSGVVGEDNQSAYLHARESEAASKRNSAIPAGERLFEYMRTVACREAAGMWVIGNPDGTCPPGVGAAGAAACEGDSIVLPMWRRERATPASAWGNWVQIDVGGCGADLLPELTAEDFRRLPIPAPVLTLQPDRGWVLVNKETVVMTDPTPATLTTNLLGYDIQVQATPTTYTYDFGDGTAPLVTTSPGHAWPDHDTAHVYGAPGSVSITLTTTWSGRYLIEGTTQWRDVDGTAQTTTTSDPFTIEERTSRLVAELCSATPRPPDC